MTQTERILNSLNACSAKVDFYRNTPFKKAYAKAPYDDLLWLLGQLDVLGDGNSCPCGWCGSSLIRFASLETSASDDDAAYAAELVREEFPWKLVAALLQERGFKVSE